MLKEKFEDLLAEKEVEVHDIKMEIHMIEYELRSLPDERYQVEKEIEQLKTSLESHSRTHIMLYFFGMALSIINYFFWF